MSRRRTHAPEAAVLVRLSNELVAALRAILRGASFAGLGPIELGREIGVDKSFASRLLSALRARDPMVALSLLPGVVPMRQFIAAARKHGAGPRAVAQAERRLQAFDHELERTFGTRTRLDAVLADALPQARRRQEDVARQAVYRGMALIKGISIDLESFTWILHPGRRDPRRVDIAFLGAFVGIHRLRPTARFRAAASYRGTRPEAGPRLLRRYCRPARLSIRESREKDFTFYEIASGSVHRDAAADVFLTQLLPGAATRARSARAKGTWSVGDVLAYPVRRLELTLLVHEDVWPGCAFSVRAYDTNLRGAVRLPDPSREADRLPIEATVVRSPADSDALRASPVPRYLDIVHDLTASLGWELEAESGRPAFRRFGCEIAYPLYGAQVLMVRDSSGGKPRPPSARG